MVLVDLKRALTGAGFFLRFGALFTVWVLSLTLLIPGADAKTPIRSAAEIDYPPFCFVDEKGKPSGFSVELMRAALESMGREVTGLGLATVYGIVKQNGGYINVYSEPGKGSTFRIYIPRYAGEQIEAAASMPEALPRGNGETILLVEDEPAIMSMGKMMLEKLGYQVLAAGTPKEALRLAVAHPGEIHLLITDLVMPEMNGRQLSDELHTLFPKIKSLFMSGYTANVIAHHGVLEEGVHFIQKPFSMKELAKNTRAALDHSSAPPDHGRPRALK